MKKNNIKKEIVGFIQNEFNNITQLLEELNTCGGNTHAIKRAKGSILHDFYNACERIFETIAREINGGISANEQWHKRPLYQMTLPIEGIRPQVISKKLASELDEYLAFRHLFRNIYGFELEGDRLDPLVDKFSDVVKSFENEIRDFIRKL